MIKTASQYHRHTSYERGKIGGHFLDWPNQPDIFKKYHGITPIQLPDKIPYLKKVLISVLKETDIDSTHQEIDIKVLSMILRLTCSIAAKARHGNEDFYYRSPASAGALYPSEIYVTATGIKGLDDGLYHYGIQRHSLFRLRKGDLAGNIREHTFNSAGNLPTLAFIFTAIFFRSSWKYRDRAYRYHLLDTGHVIENLALAIKAFSLPLNIFYDFNDFEINKLTGVYDNKEVALAVASVSFSGSMKDLRPQYEIHKLPDNILNKSIVSGHEKDYPAIGEIHKSGEMTGMKDNPAPDIYENPSFIPVTWNNLPDSLANTKQIEYPECLFKRRSSRNFMNVPISKNTFFSLLESLCLGKKSTSEYIVFPYNSLTIGFLAGNIESIEPGFYILDPIKKRFGMLAAGNFIRSMARACLDQEWLKNAGAHFLFISDLNILDKRWGARGYRHAMMTAGRMGQRIYIASTALNLGCCGIGAFYDEEAAVLIGLKNDSRLLYLMAVGKTKSNIM